MVPVVRKTSPGPGRGETTSAGRRPVIWATSPAKVAASAAGRPARGSMTMRAPDPQVRVPVAPVHWRRLGTTAGCAASVPVLAGGEADARPVPTADRAVTARTAAARAATGLVIRDLLLALLGRGRERCRTAMPPKG